MASVKNLASGILVSGINVGDTTLTVAVGSGTSEELLAVWPTPPFYITVAPDYPASGVSNSLDSEIMSVTAIAYSSGNIVMTVTRAQRGTTAKAFNANAIVTNAIYADDAVLLGPNGTTESPSPWIQAADIIDGSITVDKLAEYTANKALRTTANLEPTADTPQAWLALFGNAGFYVTGYSANHFTNQPNNYGVLETYHGNNTIHQKFLTVDGNSYYRAGSNSGWYGGGSTTSGAFRRIVDSNVEEGTITMNQGWIAGGSSYCRKQGNVVQWNINLTGTSTMVTNTAYVVGRLPAGFIPSADTVQIGIYRTSSQTPVLMYCIAYATTGNILVASPIDVPSGGIRFIGGTFIVP